MFSALAREEVPDYWQACALIIEAATLWPKARCYSAEDYFQPICAGAMQLWGVFEPNGKIKGCVITAIENGSLNRICMVHVLAGDGMDSWAHEADEAITSFAKLHGCSAIQYAGRKGFKQVFPDLVEDGIIYVRILK